MLTRAGMALTSILRLPAGAVLVGAVLIFAAPVAEAASGELSAADTDWVPGDSISAKWSQCPGSYVQPEIPPAEETTRTASARSATHQDNQITTLAGQVAFVYDRLQIHGDRATIDAETEQYSVEGSVRIREPGLLVHGSRATGNLRDGSARVTDASFLLHEHQLRGTAETISRAPVPQNPEKTDAGTDAGTDADTKGATGSANNNHLIITSGTFTTCAPGSNAWTITGKSIELKQALGHGIARGMTLRVKDVPIAYFPWFRFPINDQRQSGFLSPGAGTDKDGGTDIVIPYYLNLAPHYDATYSLRSLWKRGVMHEAEFRYLGKHTHNLIAGTLLPRDDKYDDRVPFDPTQPAAGFKKQDRWLVHLAHRGGTQSWISRINYTSVSDVDYLRDLGSSGKETGSNHSAALRRVGSLSWYARHWRGSLAFQDFQNLNQIPLNQYNTLPRLALDYSRRFSAINIKSKVQLSRFDRKADDRNPNPIVGSRFITDSEISLRLRKPWGFITPGLGIIHRRYRLDDVPQADREAPTITTRRASLDAGLVFERQTSPAATEGFYQTLEPRAYLLYVEEDFQNDLPTFDSIAITPGLSQIFRPNRFTGYDRIGDASQVSLGLTTNLSSVATGEQLLRVGMGQILYFRNRKVTLDTGPDLDRTATTSPLFVSAQARFSRTLTARALYERDTDASRSNRGYIGLKYRAHNRAVFNLSYTYSNSQVQRPNEDESRERVKHIVQLARQPHLAGDGSMELSS